MSCDITEVGVAGFEPTAPRSQSGCATKLRHTPWRPECRRTTAPRSRDLRARRTHARPMRPDGAGSVPAEAPDERALSEARDLFDACRWRCTERLAAGDANQALDGEGVGLLGGAAFLVGAEEESVAAFGRAHQRFLGCSSVQASASRNRTSGLSALLPTGLCVPARLVGSAKRYARLGLEPVDLDLRGSSERGARPLHSLAGVAQW